MNIQETPKQFVDYVNHNFDIRKESEMLKGAIKASMGAGNKKGARLRPNTEFTISLQEQLNTMLDRIMNEQNMSQEKYDAIFNETIKNMEKEASSKDHECAFSFGRFQKIINIWIKYHIALSYYENKNSDFTEYKKLLPFAHIPVDRIVINGFLNKKNVELDKETRDKIKRIGSWKWNLTEDTYKTIQDAARNISKEQEKSPLELEMEIWNSENIKA